MNPAKNRDSIGLGNDGCRTFRRNKTVDNIINRLQCTEVTFNSFVTLRTSTFEQIEIKREWPFAFRGRNT